MEEKKHVHKKHVHHGRSTSSILEADRVLQEIGINRGEVFLDAGCGDGFISLRAVDYTGEEGKVYALDIYEKSIEELRRKVKEKNILNLEPVIADITEKTPLPDGSVDVCLLANVLHGFVENNELDSAMREIIRVMKPGGRLAVVEFKKPERFLKFWKIWRNLKLYFVGPPLKVKLSPQETELYLRGYGLSTLKVSEVGEFHYVWLGTLSQK